MDIDKDDGTLCKTYQIINMDMLSDLAKQTEDTDYRAPSFECGTENSNVYCLVYSPQITT
jgi:hypothetical protein